MTKNKEVTLPAWRWTPRVTVQFFIGFIPIIAAGTAILYYQFRPMPYCNLWYCDLPLLALAAIVFGQFFYWKHNGIKNIRHYINRLPLLAGATMAITFVIINYLTMRQ